MSNNIKQFTAFTLADWEQDIYAAYVAIDKARKERRATLPVMTARSVIIAITR